MTSRRALVAVVAGALLVRFVGLGGRVAHFDEARLAFWVLQYSRTGEWTYFPYLHGPFLFHVGRRLFGLLGPSDWAFRAPVALVGGLLPAVAVWFRDHLDDRETLALAVLLAGAPLLVFYSRFARNDLLVAAFSLAALGALLRFHASGTGRYLPLAGVAFALALSTKENALLYLLCWLGATGVLRAYPHVVAGDVRSTLERRLRTRLPGGFRGPDPAWQPGVRSALGVVGAAVVALALLVLMYAPRGGDGPRLAWLVDPERAPAVVETALVGSARELLQVWVLSAWHMAYPSALGLLTFVLLTTGLATLGLAVFGAGVERQARGHPRWLVAFAWLWAGASLLGYPYASDISAGWTVVHVLVPLTIPGAVGLVALQDRLAAGGTGRRGQAVLAIGAAWLVVAWVALFAFPASPVVPFGQPGQPTGDLGPTMAVVTDVAAEQDGVDVAFYGSYHAERFIHRLPFPWYLSAVDARVDVRPDALGDPPPVVVTLDRHDATLADRLAGYRCLTTELTTWVDREPLAWRTETVVYVDADWLPDDARGGWRRPGTCDGPDGLLGPLRTPR